MHETLYILCNLRCYNVKFKDTYKKPMQDNYKLSFVYTQLKVYETAMFM